MWAARRSVLTLLTVLPTPLSRRTGGATSRTPLEPGSSQVDQVWYLESWRSSNKARAVIESGWQERAANACNEIKHLNFMFFILVFDQPELGVHMLVCHSVP